jgi:hypothetical protein
VHDGGAAAVGEESAEKCQVFCFKGAAEMNSKSMPMMIDAMAYWLAANGERYNNWYLSSVFEATRDKGSGSPVRELLST